MAFYEPKSYKAITLGDLFMSSDIFLFLSDEAFASVSRATVVKYADIKQTGVGMLDDNLLNYFIEHSIFLDPISDGNNAVRTSRTNVDEQSRCIPNGRMMLHFDADKLLKPKNATFSNDLVEGFVVNSNDDAGLAATKRTRLGSLFNIIDTIFNARNSEGSPKASTLIDAILTNSSESGTTYNGYVPQSLTLSTGKSQATTRLATQGSALSEPRLYWNSCKFDYSFTNSYNIVVKITFNIWLNAEEFKANYPFSTVVDCLYPCSAKWIMNPQLYANQTRAILLSSNYKNEMIERAVTERDHSGVMLISSRYMGEYSDELPMSFALMYKGAKPTTSAARTFLRSKLLEEVNDNGNKWTEYEWRRMLPDLFVDGSYYLIPMYFQRVPLPDSNISVEKSCVNYQKIFTIARSILGGMGLDDASLMSNMDILQAPGHSLYIVGIAADPTTTIPLHELHSTYSAVDALSESFDGMTAGDQDFAEKLAQAMAICLHLAEDPGANGGFTEGVIGNRPAKVFTAGDGHNNSNMEYIMLVYDKNDTIWR